MYIILEGIDCCGKDSQADMLAGRLRQLGLGVLRVNEPDDTLPTGQLLRQMLKDGSYVEAHVAMFLADRMAMLATKVRPALERGEVVISARSWLSTLVYQQDNWPLDWLIDIHRVLPVKATHLFVLDLPAETAMERKSRRPGHAEYYEKLETQNRNRGRYEALFDPLTRPAGFDACLADESMCRWIDGRGTQTVVHEAIWQHLNDEVLRLTGLHKGAV